MSGQQHGGQAPLTSVPQALRSGDNGEQSKVPPLNPFDGPVLRALPPLPHPHLLSSMSSSTALDLRRQMEHLSRLADRIVSTGLGTSQHSLHLSALCRSAERLGIDL